MWMAVQKALASKKPVKVFVNGEEDMASLVCMLLADEGYCIVYGLFDRGVCVVKSGKGAKKVAKGILSRIVQSQ